MKFSHYRLAGGSRHATLWTWVAVVILTLALTACGGGGSPDETSAATECIPGDETTAAECGTLYVGVTDADGDFLSYAVDLVSIELHKANGAVVEALPASTRIDFSQYVDLTEFVTAPMLPPGTYVAAYVTLDYTDAEVFVESNGAAKAADVVDTDGNPLTQTQLKINLSSRDQLFISRGRPSLLTVDFDLAASHSVDSMSTPALATAEPFIVAEVNPVDEKDIRVRGLLIESNPAGMQYTVAIRPFYDRIGDFGSVDVSVADDTEFEVDGVMYSGPDGLEALARSGRDTLTVARGTLNVAEREFTADMVLGGTSVPGSDMDAVKGNVIARNGNDIVVRGGTVILRDTRAFFRDDVTVTVGPDTRVFKTTFDGLLDVSAISVGQAVTVRGVVTENDELGVQMDATAGAVRMQMTHLSGLVNTINIGQADIQLHAIDRRRVDTFDFSGTGTSPMMDADPANYEIATGNLLMDNQAIGEPVVVFGFANTFGAAPHDFEGRTLVEYSDVRSALGVGWGSTGTIAPFLSMGSDGLVLDNRNRDIDQRHHIKHGPMLIDLTTLDSDTLIAPRESDRMLFMIKAADSLQMYSDFDEFVEALGLALNGATTARSMHARGQYDIDRNVFTAHKIGIYLMEP